MKKEVVLTDDVDRKAKAHLLAFFEQDIVQENLCFAMWHPSQGAERFTAVVNELVLPRQDEVQLHGNASFEGKYLTRATREAKRRKAGLVMMHSHPAKGWQDLSQPDIFAERDVVAYQAQATKKPFLGMTIGRDGYWSARFWTRKAVGMELEWCRKVRVPKKRDTRLTGTLLRLNILLLPHYLNGALKRGVLVYKRAYIACELGLLVWVVLVQLLLNP